MRDNYSVKVIETIGEFTKKELIRLKDTGICQKLDEIVTESEKLIIDPLKAVAFSVHNEKSENKDYSIYVIIDKNGDSYVTGSQSFWDSYTDIVGDMSDSDEEWSLEVYKMESKNYRGKYFLTCSVL